MFKIFLSMFLVGVMFSTSAYAGVAILNKTALKNGEDLTTPTSDQKYPLGMKIFVEDTSKTAVKSFVYVKANEALSQYGVYDVIGSSIAAREYMAVTGTARSASQNIKAVPQAAFTINYYGFAQTGGDAIVLCASTATAAGQACRAVYNSATSATTSGTSISSTTFGIYKLGVTTGKMNVLLLDKPCYSW